jgi:hypothetical protein
MFGPARPVSYRSDIALAKYYLFLGPLALPVCWG